LRCGWNYRNFGFFFLVFGGAAGVYSMVKTIEEQRAG